MKNLGKRTLTGLQVATTLSGLTSTAIASNHEASPKLTQADLNQASLQTIEESWLKVPRICKAAAFNAQPVRMSYEARNESIAALYLSFNV
jgi:hypothetical protein